MANRRMFSKTITQSSSFLMMPPTSRLLYYDLGLSADDDGFCEHYTIMKMTDAKPDDLKVLQAKGFVKVFDDKVLIILDWKENNYIQNDRYTPSKYLKIYKKELLLLANNNQCIQSVSIMDTQVRLGKVRRGEDKEEMSAFADEFNQFWEVYPKKELKKKSQEIWQRKKLDGSLKVILDFIERAKNTDRWQKGYIKQPPVFLNGECWNDDLSAYNDKKQSNILKASNPNKYDKFKKD